MSIKTEYDKKKQQLLIYIEGDFDGDLVRDFEFSYEEAVEPVKHYRLNMSNVHYMDSTALGMLLALREYAHQRGADVTIYSMNDIVIEIFRVLNFHKIFKPEYSRETYLVEWVAKCPSVTEE